MGKGRRAANIGHIGPGAKIRHYCAGRNGPANGVLGESFAIRREDGGVSQKAPLCQKDIRGDDNRLRVGALGNIIIGRVKAVRHGNEINQRLARGTQKGITDDGDRYIMPPRNFIAFLAHRAGIGININVERHTGLLAPIKSRVNGFISALLFTIFTIA